MIQKAIIYCRVSSQKQVQEGNGLSSQEQSCRKYAQSKNYEVVGVFRDGAVSGKTEIRKGFQELLSCIASYHRQKISVVVIVDDVSRLARRTVLHYQFKNIIVSFSGRLESVSLELEDTPINHLTEGVQVIIAQFQREMNAIQVKSRMQARMEQGHWVLPIPLGYKRIVNEKKHKIIVPVLPSSDVIKEAFEGLVSGRFESISDVQNFLIKNPNFPKNSKGTIYHQFTGKLLSNPLYAGFIHKPDWGIKMQKGEHQAIVSPNIFFKAQAKLKQKSHLPKRADINEDFVLRGFISCSCCRTSLTASWSKGRNCLHPYYHCRNKECTVYGKSIKRFELEEKFYSLLSFLKPKKGICDLAQEVMKEVWQKKIVEISKENKVKEQSLKELDCKIELIFNQMTNCSNSTVISMYEKKILDLNNEKVKLEADLQVTDTNRLDVGTVLKKIANYIGNPDKIWEKGDFKAKRLILKLIFADKLSFSKESGFGTVLTTLSYKVFQGFGDHNNVRVELRGFEPLTSFSL